MRRLLCIGLTAFALLAACTGTPEPTAAPPLSESPTQPPVVDQPTQPPVTQAPRDFGTEMPVVLPLPGTILPPATEDPDAGLVFDTLQFDRTGGIAGQPVQLTLSSNGSGTRNGVAFTVTADQVKQIDDALDQIGFFGLQGVFTAPGTSPDAYVYRLTVDRAGASRTLDAQDGFIPPELARLFALLSNVGA